MVVIVPKMELYNMVWTFQLSCRPAYSCSMWKLWTWATCAMVERIKQDNVEVVWRVY